MNPVLQKRTELGLSQKEMADLLGCSQPAISAMETTGKIRATTLKLLATLAAPADHSVSPGAVPPAPTAAPSEPVLRPDGAAFSSKVPA